MPLPVISYVLQLKFSFAYCVALPEEFAKPTSTLHILPPSRLNGLTWELQRFTHVQGEHGSWADKHKRHADSREQPAE